MYKISFSVVFFAKKYYLYIYNMVMHRKNVENISETILEYVRWGF